MCVPLDTGSLEEGKAENRHSKLPNPLFFGNRYLLQRIKALLSGGYDTEHQFVTTQNLRDPSICFCG